MQHLSTDRFVRDGTNYLKITHLGEVREIMVVKSDYSIVESFGLSQEMMVAILSACANEFPDWFGPFELQRY